MNLLPSFTRTEKSNEIIKNRICETRNTAIDHRIDEDRNQAIIPKQQAYIDRCNHIQENKKLKISA
jgi:hypothetical protein